MKYIISLLLIVCFLLSGLLTFKLGSDAETSVPSISTSDKLTPFSIWGKRLAYTHLTDNVKRYDFGSGTTQVFDKRIESKTAHFHKIAFGFYRESDSWLN